MGNGTGEPHIEPCEEKEPRTSNSLSGLAPELLASHYHEAITLPKMHAN